MEATDCIQYYLISKEQLFYDHFASYTEDEELAYAFTNLQQAEKKAASLHAQVVERIVTYAELEQLTEFEPITLTF